MAGGWERWPQVAKAVLAHPNAPIRPGPAFISELATLHTTSRVPLFHPLDCIVCLPPSQPPLCSFLLPLCARAVSPDRR
jgi:hypothetical protein